MGSQIFHTSYFKILSTLAHPIFKKVSAFINTFEYCPIFIDSCIDYKIISGVTAISDCNFFTFSGQNHIKPFDIQNKGCGTSKQNYVIALWKPEIAFLKL